MKKYIFIAILLILGFIFLKFEFYTYFIKTEVNEEMMVTEDPTATTDTIAIGEFTKVDFVHKGSGQAKTIRIGDRNFVRLENFSVTNGPDLHVYLSKSTELDNSVESLGEYVDLGLLKGSSGNQNYDADFDLTGYKTVVIWCEKYSVLFSYALLK